MTFADRVGAQVEGSRAFLMIQRQSLRNVVWWLRAKPSRSRHVFIVGAPRSGTTLLQLLIAAHSGFAGCAGESGVFTRNNVFNSARRYCGLSEARVREVLSRSSDIVSFFDCLAMEVTNGTHRFAEKTPQHVLVLRQLLRWFPESQFVNIVRDGRDCYCSAQTNPDVPQRTGAPRFARYWRRCIRARQRLGPSERIIDVRYEDLAGDTEASLRRIMLTLGHEFESRQLAVSARTADSRSALTSFSRLSAPVGSETVGRWRREMSNEQISQFQQIAGRELRQFGYVLV